MTLFSEEQKKMLGEKLSSAHVSQRKQGGVNLSYLEGYHVIDEANRIFGFDGWSYQVSEMKYLDPEETPVGYKKEKGYRVGVVATVEVTVGGSYFSERGSVSRQDVGFGSQKSKSLVEAYEMATKEAVTDALKRALRSFGNQFGNALYDKEQRNVEDDTAHVDEEKNSSSKKEPTDQLKQTTKDFDFKAFIDGLESEEEFAEFRKKYREDIANLPNKQEIVDYFTQKRKEIN